MIATGGATGGLLVAVVAPKVFPDYYELHWGLVLCGLLFLLMCLTDKEAPSCATTATDPPIPATGERAYWRWLAWLLPALLLWAADRVFVRLTTDLNWVSTKHLLAWRVLVLVVAALAAFFFLVRGAIRTPPNWRRRFCGWFTFGLALLATNLWLQARKSGNDLVHTSRNFYGVLTIYDNNKGDPENEHRVLLHGRITHGLQFLDPVQAEWATSYFGRETGVGLALRSLPETPRRVGIVGLGAGTLATYGRAGDYFRFYEINPQVRQIAQTEFTYLGNSAAKVDLAMGDARLSMEKEPAQGFDLLALDAFSSDSIPVHLLTQESFALYQRHLKTNGVLAVHISNHYLDLEPVVVNLAKQFGYRLVKCDYDEQEDTWWVYSSTWMLLSRDEAFLKQPLIAQAARTMTTSRKNVPLWTDDFASLFQILR
jgi:spermidine synthase